MANEKNIPQTPKEKLTLSLLHVLTEFWTETSAAFATKQETGADFATQAECRAIVTNYGQQQNENS